MPVPTATLVYKVPLQGADPASLEAAVAAVPIPIDILNVAGVRVTSDTTAISTTEVTRTIVLNEGPDSAASMSSTLNPDTNGVASVDVTSPGKGYIVPPPIVFIDPSVASSLKAFLNSRKRGASAAAFLGVQAVDIVSGGAGYSSQTKIGFVGGFPLGSARMIPPAFTTPASVFPSPKFPPIPFASGSPTMTTRTRDPFWFNIAEETQPTETEIEIGGYNLVGSVKVTDGGKGYDPATTTVEFLADQPPTGAQLPPLPARGFATVDSKGHVTGVVLTDPGRGYTSAPKCIVKDLGSSPGSAPNVSAKTSVSMQRGRPAQATPKLTNGVITGINLTDSGDGYVSVPNIVVFDPTGSGSGAVLSAYNEMGVSRVDVLAQGKGYTGAPLVVPVPFFEMQFLLSLFKGLDLTPTFFSNFMTARIARAIASPVFAAPPV